MPPDGTAPPPAPPRTREEVIALAASDPVALLMMTAEDVGAMPPDALEARIELLTSSRAEVGLPTIARIFHRALATVATWKWRQATGIPSGQVSTRFTHLPPPIPGRTRPAPSGRGRPGPLYRLADVVDFGIRNRMISNRSYTVLPGRRNSPGRTPDAEKRVA